MRLTSEGLCKPAPICGRARSVVCHALLFEVTRSEGAHQPAAVSLGLSLRLEFALATGFFGAVVSFVESVQSHDHPVLR